MSKQRKKGSRLRVATNRNKPEWAVSYLPYEALLKERVVGQSEACSQVAAIVANQVARNATHEPPPAARCLIVGPPSSGKSFLAAQAAKLLSLPTANISLAAITPEGFKGATLSDGLQQLVVEGGVGGIERTERSSVLICDEFDKLIRRSSQDDWVAQIQYNMLPLLGGEPMLLPSFDDCDTQPFQTWNVMTFLLGVFPEIASKSWRSLDSARAALVRYGFCDELVSRISHVIVLKPLCPKDLATLIERESNSISTLYSTGSYTPTLHRKEISDLAKRTLRSPFGIRGSRAEIHQLLFQKAARTAVDIIVDG